jgi:hypothetical protein
MKPKLLLGLALVLSGGLFGCSTPHRQVATADSSLSVESFQFIVAGTTIREVNIKLGQTDRPYAGSFCDFYNYRLSDGTGVTIGVDTHGKILFVQHGRDTLFGDPLFYQKR